MSWKEEVEGIEARRQAASALGGADNVERQHQAGRLTVRERIDALLDPGSFREQGAIAGYSERDAEGKLQRFTPANYVLGFGKIDDLRRFIDTCDTFGLPIVSFVDEPGFMIGPDAEKSATIRHGVALMFAVMQSSVPWISVIVRKVFGVAGGAHFGPGGMRVAWPSAEQGALPVEGGVAVAFRREIAAAPDPEQRRRELEEVLLAARSPYAAAEGYGVHDMIDPRHTRPVLCDWVEMIQPRLSAPRGVRAYSYRP